MRETMRRSVARARLRPAPTAAPADGRDGRHADVADRREGAVDGLEVAVGLVLDGVAAGVGEDAAHGAGAEVLAAGDDEGADGGVGLGGCGRRR